MFLKSRVFFCSNNIFPDFVLQYIYIYIIFFLEINTHFLTLKSFLVFSHFKSYNFKKLHVAMVSTIIIQVQHQMSSCYGSNQNIVRCIIIVKTKISSLPKEKCARRLLHKLSYLNYVKNYVTLIKVTCLD